MSNVHVTPTGQVRRCHAEVRSCKYGVETHFENEADARKFAENRAAQEDGGNYLVGKKKAKAEQPSLPGLDDIESPESGKSPATNDGIEEQKSYPSWHDDANAVQRFLSNRNISQVQHGELLEGGKDWSSEELKDMLYSTPPQGVLNRRMVSYHGPGMTPQLRVAAVRRLNTSFLDEKTVRGLGSDTKHVALSATPEQRIWIARYTEDQDTLKLLAGSHGMLMDQAESEDTYRSSRDMDSYRHTAMALYRNPNSPDKVRELMAKMDDNVASLKRVQDGTVNRGTDPKSLIMSHTNPSRNSATGAETYVFDKDKLKEAGIQAKDVDALVRFQYGNHLFGAKYNEETGTYTGYRD